MRANISQWAIFILLTSGILGIADAGYLTYSFFAKQSVYCSILDGCNLVLASEYATLGGIPLALAGLLFYVAVTVLVLGLMQTGRRRYLTVLALLVLPALLISAVLVYLQVAVIGALCFYCLISAGLSFILALCVTFALSRTPLQYGQQ